MTIRNSKSENEAKEVEFTRPPLIVDELYRNASNNWKNPQDVFNRMFKRSQDEVGIQNAGGFRFKIRRGEQPKTEKPILNSAFVILYTDDGQPEWPDSLEIETGLFTYYGDNRKPGLVRNTKIGGNLFLESSFNHLHQGTRERIAPLLIFKNLKQGNETYLKFLGLAAPGAVSWTLGEDLVSVFRSKEGKRFENFRAVFTILAEPEISWSWIDDLVRNVEPIQSEHCPRSWLSFVKGGTYNSLQAPAVKKVRSKADQTPDQVDMHILDALYRLTDREFEFATKAIVAILNRGFSNLTVTPGVGDRGRDVEGVLNLGQAPFGISLPLIAEAKQWKNSVGPDRIKRLASQMRHFHIGVFVTTSYFTKQVYQEIEDNGWPVMLISGADIVQVLKRSGIAGKDKQDVYERWIQKVRLEAQPSIS